MYLLGGLLIILVIQGSYVFFPGSQQFTIFITGISAIGLVIDVAIISLWMYLCIVDVSYETVIALFSGFLMLLFTVMLFSTSMHITENTNTIAYLLTKNADKVIKVRSKLDNKVNTIKTDQRSYVDMIFDFLLSWKNEMQVANKRKKK